MGHMLKCGFTQQGKLPVSSKLLLTGVTYIDNCGQPDLDHTLEET